MFQSMKDGGCNTSSDRRYIQWCAYLHPRDCLLSAMRFQISRRSEVDRVAGPPSPAAKPSSVASYGRVMRDQCGRTAVHACWRGCAQSR